MIGLLRFVGLLNAAVWFGSVVFFLLGANPAATSPEMSKLLGAKNFPYFSFWISDLIVLSFFHLSLVCSIVAVLHLMAEWLYFGKYPGRFWLSLVLGLCLGTVAQLYGIQPRLEMCHQLQYTHPQRRDSAARAFRAWRGVSVVVDVLLVGGIAVYLWRLANPPNATRFVSTTKFRS